MMRARWGAKGGVWAAVIGALFGVGACSSTTSNETGPGEGGGSTGTAATCPMKTPSFDGTTPCSDESALCSFGEECCCGSCHSSYSCRCTGGAWICSYTDACYSPSCGEDGGPAMKPGLIHVTVNYMGSVTVTNADTLYVGAYPAGMPKEGTPPAFLLEPSPMFPVMGTLVLEPGAYDLTAALDIGSNSSPGDPGPEDLAGASSAPIEIKGGDEHAVDILIMDK